MSQDCGNIQKPAGTKEEKLVWMANMQHYLASSKDVTPSARPSAKRIALSNSSIKE
jgi:hypothetical protein